MKRFITIWLALICICLVAAGCTNNAIDVDLKSITASPKLTSDYEELTKVPEVTPMVTEVPTVCLETDSPTTKPSASTQSPATDMPKPTPTHSIENDEKVVYLTFDDGPSPKYTEQLLDILDEYDVKATFFTVGYFVDRHPEIVKNAMQRGHIIACHTYSHEYNEVYASSQAFMDEIHKWEESIEKATGVFPSWKILRFPGGSKNTYLSDEVRAEIMETLSENGYNYYDWFFGDNDLWPAGNKEDLPFKDYLMKSFEETMRNAISAHKPLIFLAHETCKESVELLPKMLDKLVEEGYTFATLDSFEGSTGF